MRIIAQLLLLVTVSLSIDTSDAITRRLGTTHHSLALGGGVDSSSSSSLPSVDQDGGNVYSPSSSSFSSRSTDTTVTRRAQRWRRYSRATSSSASSSNTPLPSTSIAPTIPSLRLHLLRGGEVGVKNINKNIKKMFSDDVYVDIEGNLYSSPSFSASISTIALSMKIRGGGTVCVDNERNLYDPFSAALTAAAAGAASQQQQRRRRRLPSHSQPSSSSSAAVDTLSSRPHHQRIIPASLSKTASSSSSSSRSSSTSKTIPAAHQDH